MTVDLFYCDCHINARLRTYDSRYMAPSRRIVYQKDIAGTKTLLGAIADLHLTVTGEIDYVLASRCHMPVVNLAGRRVTKNDAVSRLEFSDVHFDFFKVRFAVLSTINACDFHECALSQRILQNAKLIFVIKPVDRNAMEISNQFDCRLTLAVTGRSEQRESRSGALHC
jgi:hypothetical protein